MANFGPTGLDVSNPKTRVQVYSTKSLAYCVHSITVGKLVCLISWVWMRVERTLFRGKTEVHVHLCI